MSIIDSVEGILIRVNSATSRAMAGKQDAAKKDFLEVDREWSQDIKKYCKTQRFCLSGRDEARIIKSPPIDSVVFEKGMLHLTYLYCVIADSLGLRGTEFCTSDGSVTIHGDSSVIDLSQILHASLSIEMAALAADYVNQPSAFPEFYRWTHEDGTSSYYSVTPVQAWESFCQSYADSLKFNVLPLRNEGTFADRQPSLVDSRLSLMSFRAAMEGRLAAINESSWTTHRYAIGLLMDIVRSSITEKVA